MNDPDVITTYYEPTTDEMQALVHSMSGRQNFENTLRRNAQFIDSKLQEYLTQEEYQKIKSIGNFILSGMSLSESFTLTFTTNQEYNSIRDKSEFVGKYVDFMMMSFKAKLTRTLTDSAHTNDKVAGWIMERKYEEYSAKKVGDFELSKKEHVLDKAMEEILNMGDSVPLIGSKK